MVKILCRDGLKCIVEQEQLLKSASKVKPKIQKLLVQNSDKKFINSICILIYNLLEGKLQPSDEELQKLKKFKKALRELVTKSELSKKKQILQKGGLLNVLLPILLNGISVASSLLSK